MESVRVLVTGVAGGVGQAIVKALRMARLPITIVGVDITALAAGMYWCDESAVIPRVEDTGAFETIVEFISARRIDLVMIGSERDLGFFAERRGAIEEVSGAVVVVSPPRTIALAADKWLTTCFLRDNGLPYAEAAPADTLEAALDAAHDLGFPVIVKPRVGTSSTNVHLVMDDDALAKVFPLVPRAMVQRLAGEPRRELHQELTCSVFRAGDGTLIGPFTAKRTLKHGDSWIVEVAEFASVHPVLVAIAAKLEIVGSFNVQLMDGPRGPVPFEFNARFSGTTAMRAHFGFNEPEMAVCSYALGQTPEMPTIGRGVGLRFLEELYLDGVCAADLEAASGALANR